MIWKSDRTFPLRSLLEAFNDPPSSSSMFAAAAAKEAERMRVSAIFILLPWISLYWFNVSTLGFVSVLEGLVILWKMCHMCDTVHLLLCYRTLERLVWSSRNLTQLCLRLVIMPCLAASIDGRMRKASKIECFARPFDTVHAWTLTTSLVCEVWLIFLAFPHQFSLHMYRVTHQAVP